MYSTYFGFSRLPFNGLTSPDELYVSAAFGEAYGALRRGIERGQGLMLLDGVPGAGKSTLLRSLAAGLDADGFTVLLADTGSDLQDMIAACRASLAGAPRSFDDTGTVSVRPLPAAQSTCSARGIVLILDDAPPLEDTVLRSLRGLIETARDAARPMSIILAAQPIVEQRLDDLDATAPGDGVPLRLCLEPLGEQEAGRYIEHKLEMAGYSGPTLFTAQAVHDAARHSRGIPKRIDTLCGMALLIAFDAGRRTVDRATLAEAVEDLDGVTWSAVPARGGLDSDPDAARGRLRRLADSLRSARWYDTARALGLRLGTSIRSKGPLVVATGARVMRALGKNGAHVMRALGKNGAHVMRALGKNGAHVMRALGTPGARARRRALRGPGSDARHSGSAARGEVRGPIAATSDQDWLLLKLGFAGALAVVVVSVLVATLASSSEDGIAPPSRAQSEPSPVVPAKHVEPESETQLALLELEQQRLEARLERTAEALREKEQIIAEQQTDIERLRQRATASEAKLAAPRAMLTPVSVLLPKDVVLSFSTPSGETFSAKPGVQPGRHVRYVQLAGELAPEAIALLKRLQEQADGFEGDRAATGEQAAPEDAGVEPASATATSEELTEDADWSDGETPGFELIAMKEPVAIEGPAASRLEIPGPPPRSPVAEDPPVRAAVDPRDGVFVSTPAPEGRATARPAPVEERAPPPSRVASAPVAAEQAPAVEERAPPPSRVASAPVAAEQPRAVEERAPPPSRAVSAPVAAEQSPVSGRTASTSPATVQVLPASVDDEAGEPGDDVYHVVAGDSLFKIARRFDVTITDLRRWNDLTDERLQIGQVLNLAPRDASSPRSNAQLLAAAASGDLRTVDALLASDAFIEARDEKGKRALMHAASSGHFAVVQLLLDKGAKVDARSATGRTALSYAAWNGHLVVLSALLRGGAQVDSNSDEGWTPLIYAAINGHAPCVQRLVDAGADVNARAREGRTALSAAVWNAHAQVARTLLDAGAEVNGKTRDGWTVLMDAAWNGHAGMVKLLLEYGADPIAKSDNGLTPLEAARQQGHEEIAAAISLSLSRPS
jgi:ankyrin repeat protein/type II secretory pathway predicted ATPase ExeA